MFWCSIALYFYSLFLFLTRPTGSTKYDTSCKKNSAILNTKKANKIYTNNAVFYIYVVRVILSACNDGFNLIDDSET